MTVTIGRRELLAALGGGGVAARGARAAARDAGGWVLATIQPHPIRLCGLPRWLKAHGYESGRNIKFEQRFAGL